MNPDHERQEQVFERLCQSYDKQPYVIRRMLTEGAVRASDRRAQFVGVDAYVEAGGAVLNDLFQPDDGGWLQDVGLLDMMVAEKLREAAAEVVAEGWKWVEVAPDLPYGYHYGLRRIAGEQPELTPEQEAAREALQAELDRLEEEYAGAPEIPEEVDQRLGEIETALAAIDERPELFEDEDMARAGVFVTLDGSGALRIERGFVRPEDEAPVEVADEPDANAGAEGAQDTIAGHGEVDEAYARATVPAEPEEDEGLKPIPDRLVSELTAHRTLALRDALGQSPDVAFLTALHALVLKLFYRYGLDTCLELDVRSPALTAQAPGLADTVSAQSLDERHQAWAAQLPKDPGALWDALGAFDGDSAQALFAHCVGLSVNAVFEPYNRRPKALAHADRVAQAVDLDMAAVGWTPTVENFLGRVTKARILAAVREAKGERTAQLIDHLKKAEMAEKAQALLAGSGWLPEPLRTPGRTLPVADELAAEVEATTEADEADVPAPIAEEDATGQETDIDPDDLSVDSEEPAIEPHAVAAE